MSLLHSPLPKTFEAQSDSEPEGEKDERSYTLTVSEDENEEGADQDGTGCSQDEEADDDDEELDEDYDEVVVNPRPLNEVTSLTDKTSPWTSIMSEPDLMSVESPEPPEGEGEDLREDEDEEEETVELLTHSGDGSREESEHQQSDSFNGSAGDSSDTDGERTIQFSAERPPKEPSSPNEASGDRVPSPTTLHATDTHDASCSLDHQDAPTQLYP